MVHRNKGLQLNNDMCVNTLLGKSSLICIHVHDLQLYLPGSSSGAG